MNECLKRYFDNLSKEDVRRWLYVVKIREEDVKKLFKYFCDSIFEFSIPEIEQVYLGLKNYLSEEQIKLFANPKFDVLQMKEIREGLEEGLGIDKVRIYADIKFSYNQMQIIKKAIKFNLNVDKVIEYIKQGFSDKQLEQILIVMINYPQSDVELIANKNYTAEYMEVIRKYISEGMDRECIKKWMNKKFHHEQLDFVLGTIIKYNFDDKKLQIFAAPKFEVSQMKAIATGLAIGLNLKTVKFYAKPKFNGDQMNAIMNALRYKALTIEEIKPYTEPEFDADEMTIIFNGLRDGVDVTIYARYWYDAAQMQWIYMGSKEGIDITLYSSQCYNAEQMQQIYRAIKLGFDKRKLSIIANPELSGIQMSLIINIFEKGATIEKVKSIANSELTSENMYLSVIKEIEDEKIKAEREELIALLF